MLSATLRISGSNSLNTSNQTVINKRNFFRQQRSIIQLPCRKGTFREWNRFISSIRTRTTLSSLVWHGFGNNQQLLLITQLASEIPRRNHPGSLTCLWWRWNLFFGYEFNCEKRKRRSVKTIILLFSYYFQI